MPVSEWHVYLLIFFFFFLHALPRQILKGSFFPLKDLEGQRGDPSMNWSCTFNDNLSSENKTKSVSHYRMGSDNNAALQKSQGSLLFSDRVRGALTPCLQAMLLAERQTHY